MRVPDAMAERLEEYSAQILRLMRADAGRDPLVDPPLFVIAFAGVLGGLITRAAASKGEPVGPLLKLAIKTMRQCAEQEVRAHGREKLQ